LQQFEAELQKSKQEINRLSNNLISLLDVMPEMVFLVKDDFTIEYMNRSAKECFGDICSTVCDRNLQNVIRQHDPFSSANSKRQGRSSDGNLIETKINDVDIECSLAPFRGYLGDNLVMIVMRDISRRKANERELEDFHTNIEYILNEKIKELKASERMRRQLSQQVNSLKLQLNKRYEADKIIGSSRVMREMREMVYQVAGTDATVLITGESGTGKELVANLLKETSNRADKPFLKINCNAINDSILESDLFGYEKGAFTGANARKKGKFEIVDGGTIFLDEIGDISPRMQASLLRVLQNGEVVRVGGTQPVKVDVRIIAATNLDLAKAVEEKRFRLDLYYRLNIINISIPPLRERKEDIVELVSHFVRQYRKAFKKDIDFVPQSIINRLLVHNWPGNVRELENLIQRAVLMAKGNMITESDLLFDKDPSGNKFEKTGSIDIESKLGLVSFKGIIADFESEIIDQALRKFKGNVAETATRLDIGKTALYDKMKRYDISAKKIKKECEC